MRLPRLVVARLVDSLVGARGTAQRGATRSLPFLALLLLLPAPSRPATKVALHVAPRADGDCAAVSATPCYAFETEAGIGQGYDVYVVAINSPNVAGIEFGLNYDPGLAVLGTQGCSDLIFPSADWPARGSGVVLTFDPLLNCQSTNLGPGPRGVFHSFYVYAYDAGAFHLGERPASGKLSVSDCLSAETPVPPEDRARIEFSAGASVAGINPCDELVPDTSPPYLVGAEATEETSSLDLFFNEPVPNADSALLYEMYDVATETPNPVTQAVFLTDRSVRLATANPFPSGTLHEVRVNGVEDASGNAILPNSTLQFLPSTETVPPVLVLASGEVGGSHIDVVFSEDVGDGSDVTANYVVTGLGAPPRTLTVTDAHAEGDTVTLQVTPSLLPETYRVEVSNVQDLAGNPVAPGSGIQFNPTSSVPLPLTDPRISAHLLPRPSKSMPCEEAELPTCSDFATAGSIAVPYDLYLVAVDVGNFYSGFTEVGFGIEYPATLGQSGWVTCADMEFPSATWPASNSGNVAVWDSLDCRTETDEDGVRAIIGRLYVYAYDQSRFNIVPRPSATPGISVADCQGNPFDSVPVPEALAEIRFGEPVGYNPCLTSWTPVREITWGALKTLYAGEKDR